MAVVASFCTLMPILPSKILRVALRFLRQETVLLTNNPQIMHPVVYVTSSGKPALAKENFHVVSSICVPQLTMSVLQLQL